MFVQEQVEQDGRSDRHRPSQGLHVSQDQVEAESHARDVQRRGSPRLSALLSEMVVAADESAVCDRSTRFLPPPSVQLVHF